MYRAYWNMEYNPFSKELTLITCNNLNLNRMIIKARQVD